MPTIHDDPETLGLCPNCETKLTVHNVLIKYEREDAHALWAECPECQDVVHPQ